VRTLSRLRTGLCVLFCIVASAHLLAANEPTPVSNGKPLPGTGPLGIPGDLAEYMIGGVDRFLLRELDLSIDRRTSLWHRDISSKAAYQKSVEPNRQHFARIIGLEDQRPPFNDLELVGTLAEPALVGRGEGFRVLAVRWPALDGVHGEGLLLEPTLAPFRASVVVVPDCEQTPEALVGLAAGIPAENQIARRLAENGCRVLVPALINRGHELSIAGHGKQHSTATHREMLYRAAYQMGRHLIGYEVQKIRAAVDWFAKTNSPTAKPIGVVGYGEGGLLALYAAAVDPRIDVAGVSGYFDSRQNVWKEPIDRNVFGLLREFGDAELATLIVPRALVVEACAGPTLQIPPGGDSAPAELKTPPLESVRHEVARARKLVAGLNSATQIDLIESGGGTGQFFSEGFLRRILAHLSIETVAAPGSPVVNLPPHFDSHPRFARQFREIYDFSQRLVDDGPHVRAQFLSKIDRNSGLDKYVASVQPYRKYLRDEIIGNFDNPLEEANPRTRAAYDDPAFRGYEVVLDVFPDVVFYGILLVPKDIPPGEKRPLVVCQHGLEGRAQFTVTGDKVSYRNFASRLARQGFVTFAPQHLYRGEDHFRTLQRKANPLKKSLFSVMIAQHRQLFKWLGSLPFVDAKRIAFYGISYGGKSAMRIPSVLDGYCLSICSSDYSDWIVRTVSNRYENGYLPHNEYEIFEFDLGSRFNYADLTGLICPRPFMMEEMHHNDLPADLDHAEFSRASLLYYDLGLSDRIQYAYWKTSHPRFAYSHRQTFDFLHDELHWPRRPSDE
jgi:dienelactone hydrolase